MYPRTPLRHSGPLASPWATVSDAGPETSRRLGNLLSKFDAHTCTSGAPPAWRLRRPPGGGATSSPGQKIGIQAGRFPASQLHCDQGDSRALKGRRRHVGASAPPPLTALVIAGRPRRIPKNSGCGRFCGRPQPNVAVHEHINPHPTDPRRATTESSSSPCSDQGCGHSRGHRCGRPHRRIPRAAVPSNGRLSARSHPGRRPAALRRGRAEPPWARDGAGRGG